MILGWGLLGRRTARRAFVRRWTSEEMTTTPAYKVETDSKDSDGDRFGHKTSSPPLASLLEQCFHGRTVDRGCPYLGNGHQWRSLVHRTTMTRTMISVNIDGKLILLRFLSEQTVRGTTE